MGYRTLQSCVDDLLRTEQLVRLEDEIDARLEAAEIQRRVYASGGPAVLFANVKNSGFPMVSNLFGTAERTRYLFRDSLDAVRRAIELKADPTAFWRNPWRYRSAPRTASTMRPRRVRGGPILANETTVDQLPQLVSWPDDGGPFVTLPMVYTEDPALPGLARSNLGMYRVQLSGGQYVTNDEVGMHYQLHRGIGIHHTKAERMGQPLKVNIFIGGAPAMMVAAVMPLPEGFSELRFAGALARRRIPMIGRPDQLPIYAQADFCISGTLEPDNVKPEGPFGDHLGYYSLEHDFPVLRVEKVYYRDGAIWPFTVVGRPPQEDTQFGGLIHELTKPMVPNVVPGVHAVHAVDAAGVHPLLLAIGSERYTPYQNLVRPQELLTQANAILGQGQMSLAKYLLIAAKDDNAELDIHDTDRFFQHMLRRVDWQRDLHFQTNTTIDTLDYSGSGLNRGSKVIVAATGPPRRELPTELPSELDLPEGFGDPRVCFAGVLAIKGPEYRDGGLEVQRFCDAFDRDAPVNRFPLIVIVDDAEFTGRDPSNFLWVTFTRSNPAADVHGIESSIVHKHWGCRGSLVIDARIKPHHAPPLIEDPRVTKKIDALATRGGPLARYL
jgi:4-hydroxy-3-polyprenylbenzoate decarboxylase